MIEKTTAYKVGEDCFVTLHFAKIAAIQRLLGPTGLCLSDRGAAAEIIVKRSADVISILSQIEVETDKPA